jgi:O-antigen ligase
MQPRLASLPVRQPSRWRRDDRHGLALAAMVWVLIVLMIVPEGFDYAQLLSSRAPSAGSPASRLLWLGLLALGLGVSLWRARLAWRLAHTLNPFFLLLMALALASVAWSIDPALSLRRLVRLGTMVAVCAAFVLMAWHARRLQNVLRPLLTLLLLASLAFGLVMPELAIHHESSPELAGAWRGLANHKNGFGALACISFIFWAHAGLAGEVKSSTAAAASALAALCLLLSRSSTSMAACAFVLLFLLLALRAPRGVRAWLPAIVAVLVSVLLVYTLALLDLMPGLGTLVAPITALTDKDATLSGRTQIWALIAEHISRRPLLGSGYGAYWSATPTAGTDSFEIVARLGSFYPGTAHNGYLEVTNDLGWVGLIALIGYLIVHVRQALQLLGADPGQGVLFLALFFQQAIGNLSESRWFNVLSVDFVLMTLASVALARAHLEQQLRLLHGEPGRPSRRGPGWRTVLLAPPAQPGQAT